MNAIDYFVYGMPSIIWILKAHTVKPTQSDAPSEVFPSTKLKKKISTKIFPHDQHICYLYLFIYF